MSGMEGWEAVILAGLESFFDEKGKLCPIVRQNHGGEMPPYPYVSYCLTEPRREKPGTYCEEPGTWNLVKPVEQVWSLTLHSGEPEESQHLALEVNRWFSVLGAEWLEEAGAVVKKLGQVTSRDNLLGAGYEYRCGFDVVLAGMDGLNRTMAEIRGSIARVKWKG